MRKVPIGWIIRSRIDRGYHSNVRVYATKATAERYARGKEVLEAFVEVV